MSKIEEAAAILKALGLPRQQQNERAALTLLALAQLTESKPWKAAAQVSMSVVGNKKALGKYPGIMHYIATHWHKEYAENSRESFRRFTLHQFVQAGLCEHNPESPELPVNSANNHYRLGNEALNVIRAYGTAKWTKALRDFHSVKGSLADLYAGRRNLKKTPLSLPDGTALLFSPGKHNQLQVAIIQDFASRFAQGAQLLYIGDTADKNLYSDATALAQLGIPIGLHSKLPDVVLYDPSKKWLFLIEAVTTHGPISGKRKMELENLLTDCKIGPVYVTAFLDEQTFRKYASVIAWDTEVWLANNPDHMIHFNGDRFMGPR